MRNTTINVSFNTEKLDALKFHMEKRDTDLQGELNDTVQKLYEKYVPQATREYIDDKVAREISTRERTRRADRTDGHGTAKRNDRKITAGVNLTRNIFHFDT